MNHIQAVIFDFNGTLFYDTNFHDAAWIEFAARYGTSLTKDELDKNIHGSTNKEILHYLFNKKLSNNRFYL